MNSKNKRETKTDCSDGDSTNTDKLSFWHIIVSVLAAAIGVQRKDNLQKDFNAKNSIYIYIAAGIIFTAIFVLTVAFVVKTVLGNIA